ncbi:hypothetical protein PInf_020789 [Phytophthora infestans]|nr:hypothetical protein PInf_020789 [Phytophthora infestans]
MAEVLPVVTAMDKAPKTDDTDYGNTAMYAKDIETKGGTSPATVYPRTSGDIVGEPLQKCP